MRIEIEGKHITLTPHLMGWIAERLEDFNTPYDDICEARVTFVQQGRRDAVCVEILLAGESLQVTQRGPTPNAAMNAAFQAVQQELHAVRTAQQVNTSIDVGQETWRAPSAFVAEDATQTTPRL
jgi:ribosome-associated translation inhibitor RaiA